MATAEMPEENSTLERTKNDRSERSDYWKKVVSHYEKRNASLERKQAALVERVRFMECALPSLLMGAVGGAKRVPEMSNNMMLSCSRLNSEQTRTCSSSAYGSREIVSNGRLRVDNAKEGCMKTEDTRRCRMHNEPKP